MQLSLNPRVQKCGPHLAGPFSDAQDAVAALAEDLVHVSQQATIAVQPERHLRYQAHVHNTCPNIVVLNCAHIAG
jgi:hypothetical protein